MRRAPYDQLRFQGTPEEVSLQWVQARRNGIGGSDVAAIMGISRYRSPYEVWLDKTGRVEPDDLSGNSAVEWGNRLEDCVARKFADEHPELRVVRRNAMLVSRERPWAFANLDRIAWAEDGTPYVMECKTAGDRRAGDWADGVPDYYLTQVTHYLSVTGYAGAWVAVLIGGSDYREFYVPRDDDDIRAVEQAVDYFWQVNVAQDRMPRMVGLESESGALAQANADWADDYAQACDEDLADAGCDLDRLEEIRAQMDALSKEKRRIEDELRARIGQARGIMTQTRRVTWTRSTCRSFDSKRFREEHAELAEQYTTEKNRDGGIRIAKRKD